MDVVVMAALAVSFAVLVTAHVSLAYGLTLERPRWRGAVALLVAPLAPYWGFRSGLRTRSLIWVVAGIAYAVALGLAFSLEAA